MKAPSALNGPNDEVVIPRGSVKTDWEVELGVVIGKRTSYVNESEALSHVAGYCVVNDVSEREYQTERGGQWDKGKGCDTFAPVGPWLVTRDEVADPQNLNLWLELNGQRVQNGNTATMIFGVKKLISYVSHFMTLVPGDILITGTPPGVGMGMKPPQFLKAGDSLRLSVEGLDVVTFPCVRRRGVGHSGHGAASVPERYRNPLRQHPCVERGGVQRGGGRTVGSGGAQRVGQIDLAQNRGGAGGGRWRQPFRSARRHHPLPAAGTQSVRLCQHT
jgi:hypothetical protein